MVNPLFNYTSTFHQFLYSFSPIPKASFPFLYLSNTAYLKLIFPICFSFIRPFNLISCLFEVGVLLLFHLRSLVVLLFLFSFFIELEIYLCHLESYQSFYHWLLYFTLTNIFPYNFVVERSIPPILVHHVMLFAIQVFTLLAPLQLIFYQLLMKS